MLGELISKIPARTHDVLVEVTADQWAYWSSNIVTDG
jgi:hypothetical protein